MLVGQWLVLLRGPEWINQQWDAARIDAMHDGDAILILDEIQKIPNWSEAAKRLWDEDTRARRPLKVVVLGSAPLLIARGLTESLAGRFESIALTHWSFSEMQALPSAFPSTSTCTTAATLAQRR